MDFSRAEVHPEPIFGGAALLIFAAYVVAVVVAGRRYGIPGLWAAWGGGIVVGSSIPFLMRESIAHVGPMAMLVHTAILAVPMGISAWVIARTVRRPRPVGIPVQLALGALSLVLSFVTVAMVAFAVIDYAVSRRYPL